MNSCDVHLLKVGNVYLQNQIYLTVDRCSSEAAIVDPAWDYEQITFLLRKLQVRLTKILLTHSHHDHVNLVDPLVQRFNPRVYMSEEEISYYEFACDNLHPLHDQQSLLLGNTPITCLLTPGHTAGGCCYLADNALFTGDTVFIEGCGVCTDKGGNPVALYESIQRIKALVHPDVRVYPGHSYGKEPGWRLRDVLQQNIYFQFENQEHFVQFRMRKNQSIHAF